MKLFAPKTWTFFDDCFGSKIRSIHPNNVHPESDDLAFRLKMNQPAFATSIIVDRPKGSVHPRCPDVIHQPGYVYLENTFAADGGGIDVWIGTREAKILTGILCLFDTLKREMEIKRFISCSEGDVQIVQQFHDEMHSLHTPNPRQSDEHSH